MPIFHCQYLENSHECDCKGFIILARQLYIGTEIVTALENLSTKQSVNEDKDEHEDRDPNEVHKCTLYDLDNHDHRLEGA